MFEREKEKYRTLNGLAETNGCVIIGGSEDMNIPLGEIRQAFSIESKLYNRSVPDLSIRNASDFYDSCVASIMPENVLLHLGAADLPFFNENPAKFDEAYRELIDCIRRSNPKCKIAIITLKNADTNPEIREMNQHLSYLADASQCEFADINKKHVVNYSQTKEVLSFIYSLGAATFSHNRFPLYDLVNILFAM